MPSEDTKKLEFPQNCKSDKATSIINAYFETLIKKIDGCKNNPDKSSTKKYANIFHADIQCLQNEKFMVLKISMMCREVKNA